MIVFVVGALRLAPPPARRHAGGRIGRDSIEWIPDCVRQVPVRLRREPRLLPAAIGYWAADCSVLVIGFAAAHGSAPLGLIVLAQIGSAPTP